MVAIGVTPGTGFEIVPAALKQKTLAILFGNRVSVAAPSGEQNHADDHNGLSYFEYLKGILLLALLFSVLVMAVCIAGEF